MRVVWLVAGLLLVSSLALAQAPAPAAGAVKIGVVAVDRLLADSAEGKVAQADLERKFAPRERELQARAAEIEKLQADLQQRAATLSEAERQRRLLDVQQKQKSLERMNEDVTAEFNAARQDVLARMAKRVNDVVQKFGKENGFHLIFDAAQAGTLFAATGADLTAQVLAVYDKQYPAPTAATPATK